jgi:hypothetical protein
MANELLDLTRIRRNWDRSAQNLEDPAPSRLAQVRAPLDPYVVAAPLLLRMELEIAHEFPEQRGLLAPFVARVETLFERMRSGTPPPAATPAASVAAAADAPAAAVLVSAAPGDVERLELRRQFVLAINDLEDLCEALLGTRR